MKSNLIVRLFALALFFVPGACVMSSSGQGNGQSSDLAVMGTGLAKQLASMITVDTNLRIGTGRVVTISNRGPRYTIIAFPDRYTGGWPKEIPIFQIAPGQHAPYEPFKNLSRGKLEVTILLKAYDGEREVGQTRLPFSVSGYGRESSVYILCDAVFDNPVTTYNGAPCGSTVYDNGGGWSWN